MPVAARSALLLLLAGLCGPALAGVQHLTCTRVSGARMHDITLTIDDGANKLSVEPYDWFSPDDAQAITFKGDTVEWTYMRGYAVLDRKTGVVAWDDTGEYEYLENIGHADAGDSEDNYRGEMQCKALGSSG